MLTAPLREPAETAAIQANLRRRRIHRAFNEAETQSATCHALPDCIAGQDLASVDSLTLILAYLYAVAADTASHRVRELGAEMERRAGQHIGNLVVQLLYLTGLEAPCLCDEYADTVRQLSLLAYRHVAPSLRQDLEPDDLAEAVITTVNVRWGHLRPFDITARMLDGEMDIAPRAIANAVSRTRPRRELEIEFTSFTEGVHEPGLGRPGDVEQELVDSLDNRTSIEAIAHSSPTARETVLALLDSDSRDDAAKRLGIKPRALYNRLRRLERLNRQVWD